MSTDKDAATLTIMARVAEQSERYEDMAEVRRPIIFCSETARREEEEDELFNGQLSIRSFTNFFIISSIL